MTASIATHYYSIFLSLGICVGIGSGCLFVPSVAIVAQYFTTRRSAATGIVATGGSIGGIVFPIAFRKLTSELGWAWANRVLGFIVLATLLLPLSVMKPRVQPARRRAMFDFSAFKESAFLLFSGGLFLVFVGLYIPFFFMPTFAQLEIRANANLSFYLVAILNAGSFFGRLIPNILADKLGAWQVLLPVTLMTSVFGFIWIAIKDTPGVIALAIFYGFFSGAVISIPPSALVVISPNLAVVGTRMGMSFSLAGLGLLIGSPAGGAIIQTGAGFAGVAGFTGATIFGGFALFVLAWLSHKRKSANAASSV
ncbi:Hypothetical protein R9X50_00191700 [Acrodontium crateriforme]|uniref:Major facilitator superfamily (MFS) profile domain-containing protein n=1 Tax=Acrodontium crateriforme TaxID=150365 RepID=A0AAQ3M0A1_9PEZI|nr:Hypothetical protein R9X50_00191700 [Acrodontium crateriforme]